MTDIYEPGWESEDFTVDTSLESEDDLQDEEQKLVAIRQRAARQKALFDATGISALIRKNIKKG